MTFYWERSRLIVTALIRQRIRDGDLQNVLHFIFQQEYFNESLKLFVSYSLIDMMSISTIVYISV